MATGAIAQGALVADELLLPYCYVRPKPKDHGMGNQIEGTIPEGAKVVVIEDLISTGGSSLKAVDECFEGDEYHLHSFLYASGGHDSPLLVQLPESLATIL